MPSPFPGVDPYLESQAWEDFHARFMVLISDPLTEQVRPRYVVKVEERVYVEHFPAEPSGVIRPDVAVLERIREPALTGAISFTAFAPSPVTLTLPMAEEKRELFLTIRDRETMEVITVIEVLSPSNKRPGSEGRREYLTKRETVLRSATHLVELDLLRGGERLPTLESLPPADFYAFVCRGQRRPRAEVYPWTLRHPLPTIPIPLAGADPDVPLDLQAVFTTLYDRAGYDYALDYHRPIEPPLSEADARWVTELIQKR